MATPYKRWGSGPTVALLSWLDFCLQNQLDFDESIIQHLRESSKEFDGGEFIVTRKQVVGKLRTICTADRPSDEEVLKPEELRTKGSQCLETLSGEIRNGIQTAVGGYSVAYAESLLGRASGKCCLLWTAIK